MDRRNDRNINNLYNEIKYFVDTKIMVLKISKIEDKYQSICSLKCYVESDWDGNNVSSKYISCWILYYQKTQYIGDHFNNRQYINNNQKKSLFKSHI